MESHELEITIDRSGKVRVHVKGVKGEACLEYLKLFEKMLNATGKVEHTAEFYEPPTGVQIHIENKSK